MGSEFDEINLETIFLTIKIVKFLGKRIEDLETKINKLENEKL